MFVLSARSGLHCSHLCTESTAPSSPCSATVPPAGWANASLATITPASLTIPAASWSTPQTLMVQPSQYADGTYHITLTFS